MARLGLVASVQPSFDAAWGGPHGMYAERLGADRVPGTNPFAQLQQAGVPLALGSDSPVTPFDPWGAVWGAVWEVVIVREGFKTRKLGRPAPPPLADMPGCEC